MEPAGRKSRGLVMLKGIIDLYFLRDWLTKE